MSIALAAVLVLGRSSSVAQRAVGDDLLHSLCDSPPDRRGFAVSSRPGTAVLDMRITSRGRTLALCTGDGARCSVTSRVPHGLHDVELRCADAAWRAQVAFAGNELSVDASAVLGRPTLVLHAPPAALRLVLATRHAGVATLPDRARGVFLVSSRRTPVTAEGRLEHWEASGWSGRELVGWPGHGYWLPEPVVVLAHSRTLVQLVGGDRSLERRQRYRVVVEAYTTEIQSPFTVRRASTLTLERSGAQLID